jgi:hypothetical protein
MRLENVTPLIVMGENSFSYFTDFSPLEPSLLFLSPMVSGEGKNDGVEPIDRQEFYCDKKAQPKSPREINLYFPSFLDRSLLLPLGTGGSPVARINIPISSAEA